MTGSAVQLAVIMGLASLAPAIILTCTCFARFAVVFSFLKNGLGTQGAPPTQILVGLALFMTLFVMAPVAEQVNEKALAPYMAGKLDEKGALEAGTPPIRDFLLKHTRQADLALFYNVSGTARPKTAAEVPLRIAVPAFVISELQTAFQMGLLMLLPFLVIDLVVATVLSSLGMVMLPPASIALPIKLLVFLAVDGWHLIVQLPLARGDRLMVTADLWHLILKTVVEVGGPFVLAALAVGVLMSLLQAATQLQDGALSFVPKLIAVGFVLLTMGPWLLNRLTTLTRTTAESIVEVGRGQR